MQLSSVAAYIFISLGGLVACWNGFLGLAHILSMFRADTKSGVSAIPLAGTIGVLIGIGLLGWFSAPVWLLWVSGILLLVDSGGPGGFLFWGTMQALSTFFLKMGNFRKSSGDKILK